MSNDVVTSNLNDATFKAINDYIKKEALKRMEKVADQSIALTKNIAAGKITPEKKVNEEKTEVTFMIAKPEEVKLAQQLKVSERLVTIIPSLFK